MDVKTRIDFGKFVGRCSKVLVSRKTTRLSSLRDARVFMAASNEHNACLLITVIGVRAEDVNDVCLSE